MKIQLAILLFLLPCPAWAQKMPTPPKQMIVLPEKVTAERMAVVEVQTELPNILWDLPPGLEKSGYYIDSNVRKLVIAQPGKWNVRVMGAKDSMPYLSTWCEVTIGPRPPPVPPTPPDPPVPPPVPPNPDDAAPIPVDGFRVLIVYETADTLSKEQHAVIHSRTVRDYLNSKCAKANGHPEWRIFDKDTPMSNESELWRTAMQLPRKEVPWIIVSNHPKGGYAGPLPKHHEEMMLLLKKWGDK